MTQITNIGRALRPAELDVLEATAGNRWPTVAKLVEQTDLDSHVVRGALGYLVRKDLVTRRSSIDISFAATTLGENVLRQQGRLHG